MNKNGIFCFVLLLAFFAIEARFLAEATNASNKIELAEELGFEAEKAWLAREVTEDNVDLAIKEALHQVLLLNFGQEETKNFVNAKLVVLTVAIEAIDKKTVKATYYFTGGILKNKKVYAKIKGKKALLEFELPAGYSINTSVAG